MKSETATLLDTVLTPGALSIVLQPILDISQRTPQLHALECLTRGPRGTNLEGADVLFEYVRRKKEEGPVDRACLRSALHACALLPGTHKISINMHASTLSRDPDIVPMLQEAARSYNIDLTRLIVEIVEHSPWCDGQSLLDNLNRLRSLGIMIALDDVGLGQSNFKMILDCRPEYLKIDRYFVHDSHKDFHRLVLLESIARVASQFGSRVIAEGVEQAADMDRLLGLGINLMQGYLFAGTASPSEILQSGLLNNEKGAVPLQLVPLAEGNYGSH